MWQPQLERLSDFHCLAPDLPGHGKSASLPVVMHEIVRDLAALIREESPSQRASIVGLSFGGVVAQALMVGAPEVVDHVILTGTATRMSRLLVWISMLNEPVLRLLRPEQVAALVCLQFGIPSRFREAMSEDFRAFSPRTLSQVMRTYLEIESPTRTSSPTLVAVGAKETFYAKRAARALARTIPGAKGVVVPHCGHVWNLEAADLFCDTVRAWVADRPLPEVLLPLPSR
jgi:pimeloyl-ACP methyl ester carboxylesterase